MAEQITCNKRSDFNRSYVHIRRIKDFPKLVLSNPVGHRQQIFQTRVSNGEQESVLSLILYPGGYDQDHTGYVAIRASLGRKIDCKIQVNVAICGRENEEHFKRLLVLTPENGLRDFAKDFVGKSTLLNTADLLRDNNVFKIACHVSICSKESERLACVSQYHKAHINQYGKLLETGDFSDFKLIAGDETFYVHKCILTTHSPVFAAMFRSDMSEKNQAFADIPDIDPDTLREMLRFIYIAEVDQLDELAGSLWIAADKYEVKGLKEVLSKYSE
ncbi:speckle-type POZ protein-like A isoform X2 [Phymastichus coffea]|uniref:speckle-type POZ protein-like A isoform X2 n=1 Tax=Phymastichus coffea TaxID=108790 RepID=UPI00273B95EA|nr:speckle-type POZ protein-like A isoform X2 [Phymastichus coffea]